MAGSVLIIDDDRLLNKLLVEQFSNMGFSAVGKLNWKSARIWLQDNDPELILLDHILPDANGESLLTDLTTKYPVIMLTAFGGVRQAVEAMHAGAADYLIKPVDQEELKLVVNRVLETEALKQNVAHYRAHCRGRDQKLLVGNSKGLAEVENLIDAVAPSDMTVLIHGESGVGKELIARELHLRSQRAQTDFIAIDCCTLQENLFESELFGHERGAFTGAEKRKKGMIEVAEGGTLFLDEIGEIGPAIQAKLLRVLETGHFRRVGGTNDLVSDVRVVAATNQDLQEMVNEKTFRGDLFYRLNAFTITMPPLRDRREDIPELAQYFVDNHNFSRRISKRFTKSVIRSLIAYDWPGNVRELKNVVERAIILSRDAKDIRVEHLAFHNASAEQEVLGTHLEFATEPSLQQIEKAYLKVLINKYSGHRENIAKAMGISERNVYRLIKKHDLGGAA